MSSRTKRIASTIALLLAFAIAQIYLPVSLAELSGNAGASPRQATAVLTTGGNQPVSVNGANTVSGATIMSGASIETPGGVGATVNFPGHFALKIDGNTRLNLEFDGSSVKVTVIRGCVELDTKKGTSGEVVNEMGQSLGKTDASKDSDDVEFCEPKAAMPTSAATSAGGSGGTSSAMTTFAIVGAAAADATLLYYIIDNSRGDNPSPSAP